MQNGVASVRRRSVRAILSSDGHVAIKDPLASAETCLKAPGPYAQYSLCRKKGRGLLVSIARHPKAMEPATQLATQPARVALIVRNQLFDRDSTYREKCDTCHQPQGPTCKLTSYLMTCHQHLHSAGFRVLSDLCNRSRPPATILSSSPGSQPAVGRTNQTPPHLSTQNASPARSLDLVLSSLAEELRLHNHWLLHDALPQDFKVALQGGNDASGVSRDDYRTRGILRRQKSATKVRVRRARRVATYEFCDVDHRGLRFVLRVGGLRLLRAVPAL